MGFTEIDFFKPKYFKAENFQDSPRDFTVRDVRDELVGPEKQLKCVVYVVEDDRGFPLNKTNFTAFAEGFGKNTDDWLGCRFRARQAIVPFNGKNVPAIRLHPVSVAKRSGPAPAPRDASDHDLIPEWEVEG